MKYLLWALLCWPVWGWAQTGLPSAPYLYVEGKATLEQPADMVTLRFELHAEDKEQANANAQVQEKAAKVFSLLKAAGIGPREIIAVEVSLEAEYEENPQTGQRGEFKGYKATRPFAVKVRDLQKFPQLVNDLISLPVEEFSGVEEGLAEPKKLQDEVWAKAMADARERADKALAPAGMKVASVYALSPVTFPQITRRIFEGANEGAYLSKSVAPDEVALDNYRLRPITVTQSVHVIYLINPK